MRDRNFKRFAGRNFRSDQRVIRFCFNVYIAADEFAFVIVQQGARNQSGFTKDLESIAYTEDLTSLVRKRNYLFHDRGKTRNSAGAQVIAI
jgi:hypothetical protein